MLSKLQRKEDGHKKRKKKTGDMSSKPDRNTRVLRFEQKKKKTADDVNEGCWRILGQICCKKINN